MNDFDAEKGVLAAVATFGDDFYYDACSRLTPDTFFDQKNALLFNAIQQCALEGTITKALIKSKLRSNKQIHIVGETYIDEVYDEPIDKISAKRLVAKIRKLYICRDVDEKLTSARKKIRQFTGEESIHTILAQTAFTFDHLFDERDSPVLIGAGARERYRELEENPIEQVGISTGFPLYDAAIGGGLRNGTNIIAARIKEGKSTFMVNVGLFQAKTLGIPVLYLDTEMTNEEQQDRVLAHLSQVDLGKVSTGKFSRDYMDKKNIESGLRKMEKLPFYMMPVANIPFEEQIAQIARWIRQVPGVRPDGSANKCVVIYDYMKLTSSSKLNESLREHQLLGFMMTTIHNVGLLYKIPILSAVQLNRDGITKESTDTASGSDRILWICNNFAIFKSKSHEEITRDGPEMGNKKLVILVTRHGPGLDQGDYINFFMDGSICTIEEGMAKSEQNEIRNSAVTSSDSNPVI